jgi:hypothetical protein
MIHAALPVLGGKGVEADKISLRQVHRKWEDRRRRSEGRKRTGASRRGVEVGNSQAGKEGPS